MSDVTPKALAKYMEKRNQRFAAVSQTARRVKIEQNHTWRLRLLPVEVGPEKEPFVDIAQHWWNRQPLYCPKHTPESWGGDPEYPCPVCELSERLRESSADEINGIGYKARCNLRVRAWCIVFDMEDARGTVDDLPISEILNPYEFDMYKTTWESFAKYQKWALSGRRGGKEVSEWGLLDLETGCDLLATQGAKGVTLDRCDPGPIFPVTDPKFDEFIQKIWGRIHKPQIILPSEKDLLDMASKIEEYAERGGSSRRRGRDEEDDRGRGRFDRGGRNRGRDEYEEDDRARGGSSRRSRFAEDQDTDAAPARGSRRQGEPEAQEEAPAPARRRAPEPEAETPAPPSRRSAAPARRAAEPEAQDGDQEEAPAPAAPAPARRGTPPAAPAPARRSAAPVEAGDDGDVAPQRPPTRRAAAAPAPASAGVDDEEDNAPEEARDPAPPVREKVEDAPPGVSATAPALKRTVGDSSDIKARLDRLNAKGR